MNAIQENKLFQRLFLSMLIIPLLISCASIPDPDLIDDTQVVEVETNDVKELNDAGVSNEAKAEASDAVIDRPVFSSSKEYLRFGIQNLQDGNDSDAKWAFKQALALNSNSLKAKNLLSQFDVDPIEVLGSENFSHHLEDGETLSKLAAHFLNDPLKFYILAKYNNIPVPSRVKIGDEIRIPGVESHFSPMSSNAEKRIAQISSSESLDIIDANDLFEANDFIAVVSLLEASEQKETVEVKNLLVQAYLELAKNTKSLSGDNSRKFWLEKAAVIEPDNDQVNIALIALSEQLDVPDAYQESLKALATRDYRNAYRLINIALENSPANLNTQKKKAEIKKQLVTYIYKQALLAQRKHELDSAIALWDELLGIDGNNENAKLYRAKAVGLKIKLEKFAAKN